MAKAKQAADGTMGKKTTARSAARKPNGTSEGTAATPFINEEQIRARAYQLYLERGANGGDPNEDWLRAESELRGRSA